MKKVGAIILLFIILVGCQNNNEASTPYYGNMTIETTYHSLVEIALDSTMVALVEVTGNDTELEYLDTTFTVSEVKVNEIFVISGVYQGRLNIRDDRIHYDAHQHGGVRTFQSKLDSLTIIQFKGTLHEILNDPRKEHGQ